MSEQVVISSDLEAARLLEERLLSIVSDCGYCEADMFAIKLALEEGLVNAVKHGNKHDPGKYVTVDWEIDDKKVTFSIADEGCGFTPCEVPDPTCDENLLRPCGRGIMLMKAYMDEVSFNPPGNQIRLVKCNSFS